MLSSSWLIRLNLLNYCYGRKFFFVICSIERLIRLAFILFSDFKSGLQLVFNCWYRPTLQDCWLYQLTVSFSNRWSEILSNSSRTSFTQCCSFLNKFLLLLTLFWPDPRIPPFNAIFTICTWHSLILAVLFFCRYENKYLICSLLLSLFFLFPIYFCLSYRPLYYVQVQSGNLNETRS